VLSTDTRDGLLDIIVVVAVMANALITAFALTATVRVSFFARLYARSEPVGTATCGGVKSVTTMFTLVEWIKTICALGPASNPNRSIFTREVTVHRLEAASGGNVIRQTHILHPDRATRHHEQQHTGSHNSFRRRRQTVTRWDDALLVRCGHTEGNRGAIFFNSRRSVLIRHPFGCLVVVVDRKIRPRRNRRER